MGNPGSGSGIEYVWLIIRIFIAEMIGSGIVNLPVMLINTTTKYEPIMMGMAMGGGLYVAQWVTYPTSGAHVNPAISLASFLTRRIELNHLAIYWAAQLAGVILSTLLGLYISPFAKQDRFWGMTFPQPEVTERQTVVMEILITSVLIVVYLATVDENRPANWVLSTGVDLTLPLMLTYIGNIIISVGTYFKRLYESIPQSWTGNNLQQLQKPVGKLMIPYIIGPAGGALIGVFLHQVVLSCRPSTDGLDTCNHYGEELPYFTLKKKGTGIKSHLHLLLRVLLAELFASAMFTLPCFLVDERNVYAAVSEAVAVAGLLYGAIWTVYPISGAHVNPIVTLAIGLTRRISPIYMPIYWLGQFLGAAFSLSLTYCLSPFAKSWPDTGLAFPRNSTSDGQAFWVECLSAFLIVTIILAATDEKRDIIWTSGDGTTIAFVHMLIYLVNIIVFVSVSKNITGSTMHPFRSLVAAAIKWNLRKQWIYLTGPVIGCLLAVVLYEVFLCEDACWVRTKAWLTDFNFDRGHSYSISGTPPEKEARRKCPSRTCSFICPQRPKFTQCCDNQSCISGKAGETFYVLGVDDDGPGWTAVVSADGARRGFLPTTHLNITLY
ncbi:unnamed protein product [Mesocestoides corti]|uniref:SH3 domain-containing protein n=1 Tax=Mesocestoides corti TaxID=53468 RepID=A0A3P6HTN0_MESCO|nr:unnamed protein product [Mesocestoides corti]